VLRAFLGDLVRAMPEKSAVSSDTCHNYFLLRALLHRRSQYQIIVFTFVLLLVVGTIDYITGVEISVSILYLVPVAISTWFLNKISGIITSIVGAIVWFSLDYLASGHYSLPIVPYWNTIVMLGIFLTLTFVLAALKKRLELEDKLAKEIQQGLLPSQFPQFQGYDIFGMWQPASIVSGDYFDVIKLNENLVGFCIGDVIGHGIPAAILMSNLQAAVRRTAFDTVEPKELCFQINNFLIDNLATGKFITFFCGILDVRNRTFTYTNAGHNPPILFRDNGIRLQSTTKGLALGIKPNFKYEQDKVQLLPGDILLCYTDGATEIRNANEEEFGDERLIKTIESSRSLGARDICDRVLQSVLQFGNNNIQDDIALLTLTIKE